MKLHSMKECVELAVSATSATLDTSELFWTYLVEKKLCYVLFFRSRILNFEGHISGGSDCGYQPPESGPESGRDIAIKSILSSSAGKD